MEVKQSFCGTDRLTQHHRGKRELTAHLIRSCPDVWAQKVPNKGPPRESQNRTHEGIFPCCFKQDGEGTMTSMSKPEMSLRQNVWPRHS